MFFSHLNFPPSNSDQEILFRTAFRAHQVHLSNLGDRQSQSTLHLHLLGCTLPRSFTKQEVQFRQGPRKLFRGSFVQIAHVETVLKTFVVELLEVRVDCVHGLLQQSHLIKRNMAFCSSRNLRLLGSLKQVWNTVRGFVGYGVGVLPIKSTPIIFSISKTAHFFSSLQPDLSSFHCPEESNMPVLHAPGSKVVCVLLQKFADVGKRCPMDHFRPLARVLECVGILNGSR